MYYRKIVGTCSCCKGPVVEEFGSEGKVLKCKHCGVIKNEDCEPVIPMTLLPKVGDIRWGVMYEVK